MLTTKKTLPIATLGAMLLAVGTVSTAPAVAALFRLSANLNDGNQFSITYDGDKLGTVNGSYNDAIVDFSFVSPTFSYSLANLIANFGTPTYNYTLISNAPGGGQSFIQNFIGDPTSSFLRTGLTLVGDVSAPGTPTSLLTESRGSFLPAPGGPLSCCTPNFLLVFDGKGDLNSDTLLNGRQAILLNSGGTYEITRVPMAKTPENFGAWWVGVVLVGAWWLRGLRVGRKNYTALGQKMSFLKQSSPSQKSEEG